MVSIPTKHTANTNTGLNVCGKTLQSSVNYTHESDMDSNGFRLHGAPEPELGSTQNSQKKIARPLKVHSPKVRIGWQKEAVQSNYDKSRGSTLQNNFDYSPGNAYQEEKPQPRGSGIDKRFTQIHSKQTHTEMDKILNPGKEKFWQPEVQPRCPTDDSMEFYKRNQKGTYGFMEPKTMVYQADDPGKIRCPSDAAKENLEKGRGLAGQLIHQELHSRTPPPNPRLGVSSESRENYERSQGSSMSAVFNQSENLRTGFSDPNPCGRTVKGNAAEQNAERNRGQAQQIFGPGRDTRPDPKPAPRVRPEAQETAAREGAGMQSTLFGGPQVESKPVPRVRLGGEEVSKRLQGTLTKEQYNYRQLPPDPPPAPKVRPEAEEYAKRERATATKNLLQMYGRLPTDGPAKPHIPPQAWNTAYRSRGSAMKDCINPSRPHSRRRRRPISAG